MSADGLCPPLLMLARIQSFLSSTTRRLLRPALVPIAPLPPAPGAVGHCAALPLLGLPPYYPLLKEAVFAVLRGSARRLTEKLARGTPPVASPKMEQGPFLQWDGVGSVGDSALCSQHFLISSRRAPPDTPRSLAMAWGEERTAHVLGNLGDPTPPGTAHPRARQQEVPEKPSQAGSKCPSSRATPGFTRRR